MTSKTTSSTIDLSWKPPFSLNISAADPDIVYCVDIYKTDTASFLILRNCSVFEPYYYFSLDNPDPKEIFTFIITSRSNVNGARNGIATTINASFLYDSKLTVIYVQVYYDYSSLVSRTCFHGKTFSFNFAYLRTIFVPKILHQERVLYRLCYVT